MTARVTVRCVTKGRLGKEVIKEVVKDVKDLRKEGKELRKELVKDIRDGGKQIRKEIEKPITDKLSTFDKPGDKFGEKLTDGWRPPGGGGPGGGGLGTEASEDLAARLAYLEAIVSALVETMQQTEDAPEPFIGAEERPDLSSSALSEEKDQQQLRDAIQQGSPEAKRLYDSPQ